MSFESELNKVTRCPMSLSVIKMDFCANTFGVSPCTATGEECYNTYKSCKDKPHFVKTTKDYEFCNNDAPRNATFLELNARPYEESIEFMGTELKEDKTIPARATFTFMDENDYDQGIDPYRSSRATDLLDVPGTYWKKWIERNPYYKGRILEHYKGFDGIAKADFVKDFSGKILNITRAGRSVKVECNDDIMDLSEQKYPFKTNIKLAADFGACPQVSSEGAMLKLDVNENDFVLRSDFVIIYTVQTPQYNPSATLDGQYFYIIVAYDADDKPIAISSSILFITESGVQNQVILDWGMDPQSGMPQARASYHRVYRTNDNGVTYNYLETALLTITDDGALSFPNVGMAPADAYRMFRFNGYDPADLNNWTELTVPQTLLLTAAPTDTTGYIKVDDEIIYYDGITGTTLQNILRLQFKSKADTPHYNGTNIKLVTWKTAQSGFAILEDLWLDAGTPSGRIDDTTLDTLAAAWTGINFSTKPIIKDTDAGKLTADLCWVMDLKYWVNEDGKLTVRRNDDETVDHTITDAANIVLDSKSVDFNQDEIKTRILLYYNRNDLTKGSDDKENYSDIHVEIEADAEGANMYNKELMMEVVTTWINDDCGTVDDIEDYVADLLNKKIKRLITPRAKLSFDVELKDHAVKVGQVVQLTSDAFNDIDGNDYTNKLAEVIKKEPAGARIKLVVKLLATDAVTTTSQHHIRIYDNPIPLRSFSLNEVKVTGLSVNGETTSGEDFTLTDKAIFEWDNMYMSEAETATNILGVTRSLPIMMAWEGFPPHPTGVESVDISSWKTTRKYNVYMFVANSGETAPATARPTTAEANGKWYLIATVPDAKINDATKKYKLEYNVPVSPLGRYVAFDVYADANLVYDPNAPVGIEMASLL